MQIIYETDRIILTPFSREMIKETDSRYKNWFYDSAVTKYNAHGLFPYGDKFEKYLDMCESGKEDIVWGIIFNRKLPSDRVHIGNISLQRINWIYRSAEFAIVIGEKDFWKMGIGFEALSLLLQHGFERLNLHRIWTGTAGINEGMRKLAEKLGMICEGHFREAVFLNGSYCNVVMYSILEDEWRKNNEKTSI